MTEQPFSHPLEAELGALYASAPLSDSFVNYLKIQLNSKITACSAPRLRSLRLRPVWIALSVLCFAIIMTTLILGPDKVYAEMRRLLGYIPGVGLVDSSAPIRVLAEQAEQTRDGVTITVTGATLTSDRSHIEYRVFGVPRSAYPKDETTQGCRQADYLLLPDGSKLERLNDFPAVPAEVNEATLVIPCISGTLPGVMPENWEFKLKFVAAPPDFTLMPVIETTPTMAETSGPESTSQPTQSEDTSVSVTQVIDTQTGYILVGEFAPQVMEGEWIQTEGMPVITDADGKNVPLKMNLDAMNNIQTGPDGWVYEIDAIGVRFPITIKFSGVAISQLDPTASVEVPFDFGAAVQPGQEWKPDLTFQLAGHSITLSSISTDARSGYDFNLDVDPNVYGLSVQIKGLTPNGGGGGGGGGLTDGKFSTSLAFAQLPVGKQTLVFSNLSVVSEPMNWSGTWSPSTPRTDLPASIELPVGTCANANTLQSAPTLPAQFIGKALVYELISGSDTWGLVTYKLDGTGREVLDPSANWGALSPDGTKVIYPVEGGFNLIDLGSLSVTLQPGSSGYDPVWSNDGSRFAFVGADDGVWVRDPSSGEQKKISSLGYESTVGWLPDNSRLITAAMFSGGSAWQVRSIDPQSGASQDLFIIEDGSYKALDAVLSPDGQWIAYRGRNNSDVHLARLDGSENHVLLDNPSVGTSGLIWAENGWLGVSLAQMNSEVQKLILVNPSDCSLYSLPGISGTLEGLAIK